MDILPDSKLTPENNTNSASTSSDGKKKQTDILSFIDNIKVKLFVTVVLTGIVIVLSVRLLNNMIGISVVDNIFGQIALFAVGIILAVKLFEKEIGIKQVKNVGKIIFWCAIVGLPLSVIWLGTIQNKPGYQDRPMNLTSIVSLAKGDPQRETEEQMILSKAYYEEARNIKLREPGLMPMNERQMLISRLEQKANRLQKANQYSNRYAGEYQEVLESLELERGILKYESQWGPAKIVKLTEANKWIPVCTIQNKQRIDYLSMHKFKKKDNFNNENTWEEAISQKYGYRITGSQDLHIEFKMYEKPTIIYYWVNNS